MSLPKPHILVVYAMLLSLLLSSKAGAQSYFEDIPDSVIIPVFIANKVASVGQWFTYTDRQDFLQDYHAFDKLGRRTVYMTAFGGSYNKYKREYNKKGQLAKFVSYDNPDTAKIKGWDILTYDSLGRETKRQSHFPGRVGGATITTYENKDGYNITTSKESWSFSQTYEKYDTSARLYTEHNFRNYKGKIENFSSWYKIYDEKGRIVENGEIEYETSFIEWAMQNTNKAKPGDLHNLYYMEIIKGNIPAYRQTSNTYTYDNAGKLTSQSGYPGPDTFIYNDKNRLIEVRKTGSPSPGGNYPLTEYTYNDAGLIIRQKQIINNKVHRDIKYIYTYHH